MGLGFRSEVKRIGDVRKGSLGPRFMVGDRGRWEAAGEVGEVGEVRPEPWTLGYPVGDKVGAGYG